MKAKLEVAYRWVPVVLYETRFRHRPSTYFLAAGTPPQEIIQRKQKSVDALSFVDDDGEVRRTAERYAGFANLRAVNLAHVHMITLGTLGSRPTLH